MTYVLGWALLNFVWQGAAIALALAVILAASRQCAATVRYTCACVALLMMLLCPPATMWLVSPNPAYESIWASRVPSIAQSATPPARVEAVGRLDERSGSRYGFASSTESQLSERADRLFEFVSGKLEQYLPWLVAAWLSGVSLLSMRLIGGWLVIVRLAKRHATPASARLQAILMRLCRELKVTRPIRLVESAAVRVPTVIGWLKPVLLLPASTLAGLSPSQLEAILSHELAHIRRHDYIVNLLQTAVETLLFYHPAVWWVSTRVRIEREHCCDDVAVRVSGDVLTYAQALTELEEFRHQGALVMAASGGRLIDRVRRLLTIQVHRPHRSPAPLVALIVATAMFTLGAGFVAGRGDASDEVRKAQPKARVVPNRRAIKNTQPTVRQEPKSPTTSSMSVASEHVHPALLPPDATEAFRRAWLEALELELARQQENERRVHTKLQEHRRQWTEQLASATERGLRKDIDRVRKAGIELEQYEWASRRTNDLEWAKTFELWRLAQEALLDLENASQVSQTPPSPPAPPAPPAVPSAPYTPNPPPASPTAPAAQTPPPPPPPPPPPAATVPPVAPAPPAPPAPPTEYALSERHGQFNMNWSDNGRRVSIRGSGQILLSDDDREVRSVGPDGYLTIEERIGGVLRRVDIEPGPGGTVTYRYVVDGKTRDFDADGRAWLAKFLPDLVRRTGFAADARIKRILARQGPTGVLTEVSLLHGDYLKGLYLRKLLDAVKLDSVQLKQAIELASREIRSDHELARILLKVASEYPSNGSTVDSIVLGTETLDSDYEHRRVLSAVLQRADLKPDAFTKVVGSARRIESDHELSRLLTSVLEAHTADSALQRAVVQAVDTIKSDYERRRVLSTLLKQNIRPDVLRPALEAAGRSTSDHELGQVLSAVATTYPLDDTTRAVFFKAVDQLRSSHERRRVLSAVVKRPNLGVETLKAVLASAALMTSEHDLASLLIEVAATHRIDATLRPAYLAASDKLRSEHEQGRVMNALVRSERR